MLKAAHTCSWKKVVPVFVEGYSHDAVSQVKSFLYAVTVVNVYVDVENPRVVSATGTHTNTQSCKERTRLSKHLMKVFQRSALSLE